MSAINPFSPVAAPYASPYLSAIAVTPSDSQKLSATPTKAIYVGGGGNLKVLTQNGETTTLDGLLVGVIYPLAVVQIFATSTTATNIVALY
jgi:hypothetical protein